MSAVFTVTGALRHYEWGGRAYLYELLGRPAGDQPAAELWLGAHPSAPATVRTDRGETPLDELVAGDPRAWLGAEASARFGGWPHLLKVLDVARPLSVQVHPNAQQARAGFDAEERAGIPRHAPERRFRDPNPKPELAVALSEFWLLYGLAPDATVRARLARHPELGELERLVARAGAGALFERALRASPRELRDWLVPVLDRVRHLPVTSRADPAFWLRRWLGPQRAEARVDRGLLGFFLMNLCRLEPGESVFQAAGVPHAYLEGQVVEIMTNSDNVLRCGLTSKPVDPEAVLAHVDLRQEPVPVHPGRRAPGAGQRLDYRSPTDAFLLSRWRLPRGEATDFRDSAASLWLVLRGQLGLCSAGRELVVGRGEAALLQPGSTARLEAREDVELFLATVPGGRRPGSLDDDAGPPSQEPGPDEER